MTPVWSPRVGPGPGRGQSCQVGGPAIVELLVWNLSWAAGTTQDIPTPPPIHTHLWLSTWLARNVWGSWRAGEKTTQAPLCETF